MKTFTKAITFVSLDQTSQTLVQASLQSPHAQAHWADIQVGDLITTPPNGQASAVVVKREWRFGEEGAVLRLFLGPVGGVAENS